jgi:hypothetical protein
VSGKVTREEAISVQEVWPRAWKYRSASFAPVQKLLPPSVAHASTWVVKPRPSWAISGVEVAWNPVTRVGVGVMARGTLGDWAAPAKLYQPCVLSASSGPGSSTQKEAVNWPLASVMVNAR